MGFLWFRTDVAKLRQRGDAKALVKALREDEVRDEAVAALGSLGERALEPLLAKLGEDKGFPFEDDAPVRAAAMIGPPAVEPLLVLVVYGSDHGKRRALEALAHRSWQLSWARAATSERPRSVTEALHRAARAPQNNAFRSEAATQLGRIGGARAIDALGVALRDPLALRLL
jgi:HEAT repeat protein